MDESELNEILLHDVPNVWDNHYYLQVWGFEIVTYKETYDMSEIMEVSEQV